MKEVVPGLPYPVAIGAGSFGRLNEILRDQDCGRAIIVVEETVAGHHAALIDQSGIAPTARILFRGGEGVKSINMLSALWESFVRLRVDRSTSLVVVGGGALCDMAGFAAATFMRGCPCVLVPTTLLAQVDASIGGKTSINLLALKNVVGLTTQPQAVIIDTDFLSSLSERHLRSGIAEMIKHGLIADQEYFQLFVSDPKPTAAALPRLVRRSIEIKGTVVVQDPHEKGVRKILNFGHTVGHAIEAGALEAGLDLTHGEAVALGMVAESWLSKKRGWLGGADCVELERTIAAAGLPVQLAISCPDEALITKMQLDKKNVGGNINCTLLRSVGHAEYDCVVDESDMREALAYLRERR